MHNNLYNAAINVWYQAQCCIMQLQNIMHYAALCIIYHAYCRNVFRLIVLMLMSCYAAVFTIKNRDDTSTSTSTSTRQSTILSAIFLNIEKSWYREFRQEMFFCACVCPYEYVASVLTFYLYAYVYFLVKTSLYM